MSIASRFQTSEIHNDALPLQIRDIEVAIGICNNLSGIITKEIDRIESAPEYRDEDIDRLQDLRWRFLRTEQSSFSRDNIEHVREFIAEYAPIIKRYVERGEIPSFIRG